MQFCPLFAHNPYLRTNRFGQLEFIGYEQIKALSVKIGAITVWDCILCFPYPFLDQVARTLDKDSFALFGKQMSDSQSHEGVG
jgi:hypothetical protein